MNTFDIFILIVMTLSVGYSVFRGFLREVFSILAIGVGYLVALNFQDDFAEWLSGLIENTIIVHIMAYSILFALAYLTIFFIGKKAKKYIRKSEAVTRVDRIWGGVLGLVKGILILVIVLFPLQFFEETYDNLTEDSYFRPHLEDMTAFLGDNIGVHREYLEDLNEMDLMDKMEDLEKNLGDTLDEGVESFQDLEENLEDHVERGKEKIDELMEIQETIQEEVSSQDRQKLEEMLRKMDKQ